MQSDLTATIRKIIEEWIQSGVPSLETAIAEYPELAENKNAVLELATFEYKFLVSTGVEITPESYSHRFPKYAQALLRVLGNVSQDELGSMPEATLKLSDSKSGPKPSPAPATSMVATPHASWPQIGEHLGQYVLLRKLGQGAFSRVYLSLDEMTQRQVVLKVTQKMTAEPSLLGNINHPNIVSLLTASQQANGLNCLVMNYVGSATLEDLIELVNPIEGGVPRPNSADVILAAAKRHHHKADQLPDLGKQAQVLAKYSFIDGLVWLFRQVADALAYVHQRNIVHQDIKPSNILLGFDGRPRLIDFNLAYASSANNSQIGGTLLYMAPEQIEQIRLPKEQRIGSNSACDIYSFGVIMYELFAGAHPWGPIPSRRGTLEIAKSMSELQRKPLVPVHLLNRRVPRRLSQLISQCLEFDPANRFPSAAELVKELQYCYTPAKKWSFVTQTYTGRAAILAASIGLVSGGAWSINSMAASQPIIAYQQPTAEEQIAAARKAIREGKPDQASAYLTQLLNSDAKAEYYHLRGIAKMMQQNWSSASEDLAQAYQLQTQSVPFATAYAETLLKSGKHQQARSIFSECLLRQPENHTVRCGVAYTQILAGNLMEAEKTINGGLESQPTHPQLLANWLNLWVMRAVTNNATLTESQLQRVEWVVKQMPNDHLFHLWAAKIYAYQLMWMKRTNKGTVQEREYLQLTGQRWFRTAYEAGVSSEHWRFDSMFLSLLGGKSPLEMGWKAPENEARYDTFSFFFGKPADLLQPEPEIAAK
ncbi:MAG: protein kinase [Zavarzinella sp.]